MTSLPGGQMSSADRTEQPEASRHANVRQESKVRPVALAIWMCLCAGGVLALFVPSLQNGVFLIVAATACLLTADIIKVSRGELDPLSVRSLVATVALLSLVAVPVVQLTTNDFRLTYGVLSASDFLTGYGYFGTLVLIGVSLMYSAAAFMERRPSMPPVRTWVVTAGGNWTPLALLIGLAAASAVAVQLIVGGPSGFVSSVTDRTGFAGLGPLFVFAESTPLLLTIWVVLRHRSRLLRAKPVTLVLLVALLAAATLVFFGGLKGSRSTTVFMLLACIGVYAFWVRPLQPKVLAWCGLVAIAFMLVYGQYKSLGSEAVRKFSAGGVQAVTEASGRDLNKVLLGDLGRSDVQAILAIRHLRGDLDLAQGRTYIGGAAIVVAPRFLFPDRPAGKEFWGTDALQGEGSYERGARSTRIYGLAGESFLNFGPIGPPVAFVVLGLWIGWLSRWSKRLGRDDVRRILVPLLSLITALAIVSDLDNLVWQSLKFLVLPGIALLLASRRGVTVPAALKKSRQSPASR